ncbi:helix-turn-helix transcriptional regulator [Streptomyces sp. B-S-A8]|uniref:Helix-turn-helix transcriptional regulator n=1 Tax=Streptomyces solicavernae TaxID=3043614 RepID=A0ABT6RW33_9ACTN|nr:helix-turn-helix transcriptional regulator [Streptomyces sp. B-S-A8]MDI3388656.1 helix-turn-helix transcriptional regulator [Streptomyces sp. B-S-A8]
MANARRHAAWEYFGEELKRRREDAGITQAELGHRVFVSGGYIGQFEQAIRKPQLDVAQRIDEVLQTGGFFERLWKKLIKEQGFADYFEHVAELERRAVKICDFEPAVIPGLLQTTAYSRALMRTANPLATDEYIEEMVRFRSNRGLILEDATRPMYWAVLHESVLRVAVGGPAVMADQLDRVARMAREHKILVQVVPFSAGSYPFMGKMMKLMEFEDAPPTVYTEGVRSGTLLDDPAVVKRVREEYDLLRAVALPPETSLTLIESAAEDYRRCASTT